MFTAQDVKNLREKTGAGMLDCKKALDETKGNIEEAINWLREKGISKALKKAERIAAEGLSEAVSNDTNAVIIEVNCETDFVARNEEFKTLINTIANAILNNEVKTMEDANKLVVDNETIEEKIVAFTAKIGEKISFRRFEKLAKTESQEFGIYSHMGGKITSVVVIEGNNHEVAKDIAMHVAAMNPSYLVSSDIPEDVLVKRLSGRRTCADCGKSYHIVYNPPKKEGVCDACGGELTQRSDESEEAVQVRIDTYNKQTKPLIDYYTMLGELTNVDGNQSMDEVAEEIYKVLDNLK